MKKQEFIEKYGEDAYLKKIEAQREYSKVWRKNHKEELKEYFQNHYKEHRDEKIDYSKNYYSNHRDDCLEKHKSYNRGHKDELNAYKKGLKQTKSGRASSIIGHYRYMDKEFGRGECDLTNEWVIEQIFNSSCIYCGETDWRHLGCDRIDNSLPHTKNNCVCSCGLCNMDRADRFTVSEFVEYRKTHPRGQDSKTIGHRIVDMGGVKVLKKISV